MSEPTGERWLRADALCVSYPGAGDALFDVALGLGPGRALGIVGRNGAGKTTLLKTIAGALRPSSGTLTYGDLDLARVRSTDVLRNGIALVPEGRRVFTSLSVEVNLRLGAYRRKKRDIAEPFQQVYELFPALHRLRRSLAGNLSGGEQQMLAVGRALMGSPSLLLLDEPSLGLAPTIGATLYAALAELRSAGLTMLIVEQGLHGVLRVADELVVLDHGRNVYHAERGRDWDLDSIMSAYLGDTRGTVVGR